MTSVAIITARGGSKRIPRKNIRLFNGKPIIAYSIEAALQSRCFDEVMVSTDDPEIAEIAKKYGAVLPFMRSNAASNDYSTTAEVLLEVLEQYQQANRQFDYACCLYPTAPFITAKILMEAYVLMTTADADSLVPVVQFGYPIQRALIIEKGKLAMMWPEHVKSRSQDLIPAYHDAGQFYWLKISSFLAQKTLFPVNTLSLVLPESQVQDIDIEEDWKLAEMKMNLLQGV